MEWTKGYIRDHPAFNPVGVFMDGGPVHFSRMCFDFVNISLWHLYDSAGQIVLSLDLTKNALIYTTNY